MLRNATGIVFLLISAMIALGLLAAGIAMGPGIAYVGAGIFALGGVLFGVAYVIVSMHPWKIKQFGVISILVSVAVFLWLMVNLPG